MKSGFLKFIAVAAMHVACITATRAQQAAGPNRPPGVPQDYVITPFGYFHPSCVGHLAPGDELRSDQGVIQHKDRTTSKIPACAHPHYRPNGEAVHGDERALKVPNVTGWLENASVTTTGSFGLLSAEWSVPYPPASNDGQTLYYFPGLEDTNDVVTILQPVLGWNSDFPSAWGIASWNCCENGTTYEATPQRVSPGDTIYGVTGCAAGGTSCTSWNVVTTDMQNGKSSQLLNTSSFNQIFNWAFGGVLEVYNVKQCPDFPTNYYISFNNILLENNLGVLIPNPNWSVGTPSSGVTPQCNYGVKLSTQAILEAGP
jgi:hypothetical protein